MTSPTGTPPRNPSDWGEGLARAKAFRADHGHLYIPADHVCADGYPLGVWALHQHLDNRADTLPARRRRTLEGLGMMWDRNEGRFQRGLAEYKAYIGRTGRTVMHQNYVSPTGYALGNWVKGVRQYWDKQPSVRQWQLLQLGFRPAPRRWLRQEVLPQLRLYRLAYGHIDVPQRGISPDGFRLGQWLTRIRKEKRQGTLDPALERALTSLGMVWEPSRGGNRHVRRGQG